MGYFFPNYFSFFFTFPPKYIVYLLLHLLHLSSPASLLTSCFLFALRACVPFTLLGQSTAAQRCSQRVQQALAQSAASLLQWITEDTIHDTQLCCLKSLQLTWIEAWLHLRFFLSLWNKSKKKHKPVNRNNAQTYTEWQMETFVHVYYCARGCVYLLVYEKLTNWTNFLHLKGIFSPQPLVMDVDVYYAWRRLIDQAEGFHPIVQGHFPLWHCVCSVSHCTTC